MPFGVKLHCWGDLACFTRPELKAERVSYDVMTPSAARGIVEAIYWKPEIRWVIDRIVVLNPIRFTSMRRNEVGTKISAKAAATAMQKGSGSLGIYVDAERQQRATLLLRDVAYLIHAHFDVLSGEMNEGKHLDQFNRRARTGQCFTRPYFGCREFPAHFALIEDNLSAPVPHDSLLGQRPLGWMLHDIDHESDHQPRFFHASMNDGVVHIPPFQVAGIHA